ncbi:hypothetical protein EYF80_049381 [Liparis tanakae]|uniref:Uncharacterized protein n=1 Tax=Liparis tanakae TaxID=230148 RepID=A0A4Z2FH04_9TELE|nr:hypothetical protein EYF80_049381 [Liparis tanakae]
MKSVMKSVTKASLPVMSSCRRRPLLRGEVTPVKCPSGVSFTGRLKLLLLVASIKLLPDGRRRAGGSPGGAFTSSC